MDIVALSETHLTKEGPPTEDKEATLSSGVDAVLGSVGKL